jgi:hypothetical protein
MRVYHWTGVIVTAGFLLNACTVGETPPAATQSPPPAATPVASAPPKASSPNTVFIKPDVKVSPNEKQPLVKASFVSSNNGGSALINTTDKSQHLDRLSKQFSQPINPKRDPFLAIDGTVPSPAVPNQPKAQPAPASRVVVNKPGVGKPSIKVLPDPTEAKSINVTGIMDVAGISYAIVNVPGEPTSRYVKVGQRLANNKVLVKRIESLGTPTVVFQQFNVEVPRQVGQQVVAAAPDATTNSGLPAPNPAAATSPDAILPPNPANLTPVEVLKPRVGPPATLSPTGLPIAPATTPQQ